VQQDTSGDLCLATTVDARWWSDPKSFNAALICPIVFPDGRNQICAGIPKRRPPESSPADERCDDDAPRGAAAVGGGPVLAFAPPAAQTDGVEEQEQEVQGQTGQRHTSQQQDRLVDKRHGGGLWKLHS